MEGNFDPNAQTRERLIQSCTGCGYGVVVPPSVPPVIIPPATEKDPGKESDREPPPTATVCPENVAPARATLAAVATTVWFYAEEQSRGPWPRLRR